MFKTLKTAQKGFTIIELLIVIAIIAILAGLVLNNFQGAQAKARDTQRVTDINNLHTKLEEYYNEHSHYPDELNQSDFPGIDAGSLQDPKGRNVNVSEQANLTAAQGVTVDEDSNDYVYAPFGCGDSGECTGYVLKTFVEKSSDTTPNPYVKTGLNNPAS